MSLLFYNYQVEARKTATYPNIGSNFVYPVLGLCGESGEVAEKIKKIIRDKNGIISEEDKKEIVKEIGDCLWYISNLCSELDVNLSSVAQGNIDKLKDRQNRGVLHGEGDNR